MVNDLLKYLMLTYLLRLDRIDGLYYECTYNGDKNELYVDVYTKIENVCISKEYKECL